MVQEINSLQEFKDVINNGSVSVIDFWAAWCGPCRVISPVFDELSKNITSIKFYKVDIDAQPDIAQEVGIRSIPAFKVFKNGNKVDELVGADPRGLTTMVNKSF
ncbi:thioredoxin [Infundibulicybe gibba]|nr:thioredoxin [Infundibulicybe gibba]